MEVPIPPALTPQSNMSELIPASAAFATKSESNGRVLVVDDVPANARLLSGILKIAGYEVEAAYDGASALARLADSALPAPDVILLDIMMPGMDGFEVCRLVKNAPETANIQIVMVTALNESSDRVQALEAGADDFLNKPVDNLEVVARVKSLVRIKRQRDALEDAYQELRRAESLRDNLTMMVVHDLRTPLTSMIGPLEMLFTDQLGPLNGTQRDIIRVCRRASHRLLALVNELLDVSKLESGEMVLDRENIRVDDLMAQTIEHTELLNQDRTTNLERRIEDGLPILCIDDDLVVRVLLNLLSNAFKHTPSGGEVAIEIRRGHLGEGMIDEEETKSSSSGEAAIVFSVSDTGMGIPVEAQQEIFDKWRQVEARKADRRNSTGLGLTFCKLAVEAHGGRIWVESQPGQGSTFSFSLPLDTTVTPS
jgi:signal transduction histidine kinase